MFTIRVSQQKNQSPQFTRVKVLHSRLCNMNPTIIASNGTIYRTNDASGTLQYIGWKDLQSDDGLVVSLAAANDTLYKLIVTGLVARYDSAKGVWESIDFNHSNKLLAGSDSNVYVLHDDGKIYKYTGNGQTWDYIGGDENARSIVADGDALYRLDEGSGRISRWAGDGTEWTSLDANPNAKAIVASGGKIYQLHNGGAIWLYNEDRGAWDNLDSNPDTIQIAVGEAGLYQLHKEHTVWKYNGDEGGPRWKEIISSDSTVVEITVADAVYARKEGGEVIKYTENGWVALI